MQYAVQTRDYKNDYRWSWEEQGREIPLAQISLKLQRLIKDGEKGVAVLASGGTFHVILTAIEKLGKVPLGMDFSGANIRLNLVFSEITQDEAKGLIRYYYLNKTDLGNAFPDIITWEANSWKVNDAKILEAFGKIPRGKITGKKLVCLGGEAKLTNWLDFDMSETGGPKFVLQSDQIMLTVDAMPKPVEGDCPIGEKPIPKKSSMGSIVSFLLFTFLMIVAGVLGIDNYNKQVRIQDLDNKQVRIRELDKSKSELETKLKEKTNEWDKACKERDAKDRELQTVQHQLDETNRQLNHVNSINQKNSQSSLITNMEQALREIEDSFTEATKATLDAIDPALKELGNQISAAKTRLEEYKDNANKPEPKQ